jgi:hypothetical protein
MIRSRIGVALSMALLGIVAVSVPAGAAKGPDFNTVLYGTAIAALSFMGFLFVVYGIKVMTGIEKDLPPPEPDPHLIQH